MIELSESSVSHVTIPNSCKRGDVIQLCVPEEEKWIFMNKCQSQSQDSITLLMQLSQKESLSPFFYFEYRKTGTDQHSATE